VAAIAILAGVKNINFDSQKVTGEYLETYLRSQDIDFDVKPRVHISDEHIYNASGFLYALGSSPTDYNFQHPPLIKYLFGYSSVFLSSPFFAQIVFAVLLPAITYYLGLRVFGSRAVAFLAAVFLILDPLYQELTSQTLLDLGQATFALLYITAALFFTSSPVVGIFLGLFAASKFWSPALVVFVLTEAFHLWNTKKIDFRRIVVTLAIAFLVFNLTYFVAYIKHDGFNIIFWQAKIAKYMLEHDAATAFGSSLALFLTGQFSRWQNTWSALWPLSFTVSVLNLLKAKNINKKFFIYVFPVVYLLSLGSQAPFSRYFILALPFLYMGLANLIINRVNMKS
jgi:hypothetical protein